MPDDPVEFGQPLTCVEDVTLRTAKAKTFVCGSEFHAVSGGVSIHYFEAGYFWRNNLSFVPAAGGEMLANQLPYAVRVGNNLPRWAVWPSTRQTRFKTTATERGRPC